MRSQAEGPSDTNVRGAHVEAASIGDVIEEYLSGSAPERDAELSAVKTALFLEEVFAITLSEDEIDPEVLRTPQTIEALLRRKLGEI